MFKKIIVIFIEKIIPKAKELEAKYTAQISEMGKRMKELVGIDVTELPEFDSRVRELLKEEINSKGEGDAFSLNRKIDLARDIHSFVQEEGGWLPGFFRDAYQKTSDELQKRNQDEYNILKIKLSAAQIHVEICSWISKISKMDFSKLVDGEIEMATDFLAYKDFIIELITPIFEAIPSTFLKTVFDMLDSENGFTDQLINRKAKNKRKLFDALKKEFGSVDEVDILTLTQLFLSMSGSSVHIKFPGS